MGTMNPKHRYNKQHLVYSGPISRVYRAIDLQTSAIVALKVVDVDLIVKPHNVDREIAFLQSQRDVASTHRLLQYLSSYRLGDDEVLVTDYYDTDLQKLIASYQKKSTVYNWQDPLQNRFVYKNQFPIDLATFIFYKLSSTLQYLHDECSIIHRDIKPSNVFFKVGVNGEVFDPVLGDFGIIYDKLKPPSDEPWPEKYTDISTGIYKAPELCFGVTDYDSSVDVWSFGILVSKLYSKDGLGCLGDSGNTDGYGGSDLGLIEAIFLHLGTPSIQEEDTHNRFKYWPQMKTNAQFALFNFINHPRQGNDVLIPRCLNHGLSEIWTDMMLYEPSLRIKARDIVSRIELIN